MRKYRRGEYPEREVYEYVRDYQTRNGYPPTQAEVKNHLGISDGKLRGALKRLARYGQIKYWPYRVRGTYVPGIKGANWNYEEGNT